MHKDPNIYPDPSAFKPERWIGDINPQMNRNYVPFTKGSRACLGIKSAIAISSKQPKASLSYPFLFPHHCFHTSFPFQLSQTSMHHPPTSVEALPALTLPSMALAEIHLVLACLFRPGGSQLQLFETDETDVIVARDFFFPAVKKGSKGVRIRVL